MQFSGGHREWSGEAAAGSRANRTAGREGQDVSRRFIRRGEIPKMTEDSCGRAQYCPNEVSSLRPAAGISCHFVEFPAPDIAPGNILPLPARCPVRSAARRRFSAPFPVPAPLPACFTAGAYSTPAASHLRRRQSPAFCFPDMDRDIPYRCGTSYEGSDFPLHPL